MRRPRTIVAALCAAALVLASCGGGGGGEKSASGNDKLTVGVIPIVDVAPIYLGQQKGFFKNRGIDLELKRPRWRCRRARRGERPVPVRLQQHHVADDRPDQGLPIKVVANGAPRPARPARTSAASWSRRARHQDGQGPGRQEDLGEHAQEHRRHDRARVGPQGRRWRPGEINFVEMAFPDMPAALSKGQVDAAWVVEPYLSKAVADGGP